MDSKLRAALLQSHPEDLPRIAQYIRWVKLRRLVYNAFYQIPAHWVMSSRLAHWV